MIFLPSGPHCDGNSYADKLKNPYMRKNQQKLKNQHAGNRHLKKQKEELDSAFTQLEKRITKLENDNDDLEQYGRRVSLRNEDVPVANEETAEEAFKKTKNMLERV